MTPRVAMKSGLISEAEVLQRAMKYLRELTDNDEKERAISTFEEILTWWQDVTRCPKAQIPKKETGEKWQALFKDQDWAEAMEKFVETAPGYKAWNISVANKLRKSEYHDVWLGLVDETNAFFEKLFSSETKKLVLDVDLQLISSLSFPRQSEDMRHLFFPKQFEYYEKNPRMDEFVSTNPKLYQSFRKRQEMKAVLGNKEHSFRYRRQDFLKNLSDKQYHKVYQGLCSPEGAELRAWTWDDLRRQVDEVIPIAENILNHVCFWYEALYEPERRTKRKTAEVFTWTRKLYESHFEVVEDAVDANTEGTNGHELAKTGVEDPLQPAMNFIDELLQLVEQNFGAWNSAEFKDLIPFTPILCYAPGEKPKREALQERYLDRFKHNEWIEILLLCQRAIPKKFAGIVEVFRGAIQKPSPKPWAKWTTLSETVAISSLWKEQDKKQLAVNGVTLSMQQYVELSGAKYVYAKHKEELKLALKHPFNTDKYLLPRLRSELTDCASHLAGYGLEVDPQNLEEDLTSLILGSTSQKHGRSDDEAAEDEEETMAGQGEGEGAIDKGLGDSPQSNESLRKTGQKRARSDDQMNGCEEDAVAGKGDVVDESSDSQQKKTKKCKIR